MGAGASVDSEEQVFIERKNEELRIENALLGCGTLEAHGSAAALPAAALMGAFDPPIPPPTAVGDVRPDPDREPTESCGFDDNLLFMDPLLDSAADALASCEDGNTGADALTATEEVTAVEVILKWTVSFPPQFGFYQGIEYSSDCCGAWLADSAAQATTAGQLQGTMSAQYHRYILAQLEAAGPSATESMKDHYLRQMQAQTHAQTLVVPGTVSGAASLTATGVPLAIAMIPGRASETRMSFRVDPNSGRTPAGTAIGAAGDLDMSFGLFRSRLDPACSLFSHPTAAPGQEHSSWGVFCRSRLELSPAGPGIGLGSEEAGRGVLLLLSLEFWREGVCAHRMQLYTVPSVVVTLVHATAVGDAHPSLAVLVGGQREYVFENIVVAAAAAATEEQSCVDVFTASVSSRYRVRIVPDAGEDRGSISGSSCAGTIVEDAGLYRTHFERSPSTVPASSSTDKETYSSQQQRDGGLGQAGAEAIQQCVICMDAPKSVVLMPCKHYCACEDCAGLLQQCPICRKMVIHTLKIFNS